MFVRLKIDPVKLIQYVYLTTRKEFCFCFLTLFWYTCQLSSQMLLIAVYIIHKTARKYVDIVSLDLIFIKILLL